MGAAAAGVVGGLCSRPAGAARPCSASRCPAPKDLPDIDAKAIAKTVGSATKQFAKTSKTVSKDLERAGDQAERIGKILN